MSQDCVTEKEKPERTSLLALFLLFNQSLMHSLIIPLKLSVKNGFFKAMFVVYFLLDANLKFIGFLMYTVW